MWGRIRKKPSADSELPPGIPGAEMDKYEKNAMEFASESSWQSSDKLTTLCK